VAARMVADVPVGALLSGGIDSSTIVALMQRHATGPVRTFTVGFADRSFDESAEAAAVAAHLGTDHTAVEVGDAEAVEVIQPSAGHLGRAVRRRLPNTRPTWSARWHAGRSPCRCRETAETSCSPATTGTPGSIGCGDCPLPCQPGSAGPLAPPWAESHRAWSRGAGRATSVLPVAWQVRNPSNKVAKLARVLAASDPEDAYEVLTTHWANSTSMVLGADPPDTLRT
jgi:asparagine synthase (glutamine-hydrolysing)